MKAAMIEEPRGGGVGVVVVGGGGGGGLSDRPTPVWGINITSLLSEYSVPVLALF